MKAEIEARLLDVNVDEFLKKLKDCNAEFVGDWLQIRNCYDFNPVRENSWIRLRRNEKETTLTIKEIGSEKIDGTKESEIAVSDFDTANEILNKLGYTARSIQENRRIRYMLQGVEVDVDMWPMIPAYVEFEAGSEEQIINVCKILGVEFEKLTTLDVQSIYSHYGINLRDLSVLKLEEDRKNKHFNEENEE
jgi:adenylate cyclase class 2